MNTDYNKMVEDFLTETGTTLEISFLRTGKHFVGDDHDRDIYEFTLKRGSREYRGTFGNSIANSLVKWTKNEAVYEKTEIALRIRGIKLENIDGIPTYKFGEYWPLIAFVKRIRLEKKEVVLPKVPQAYDILGCLTFYRPRDFNEFCDNYGYSTDSIKAKTVYEGVVSEYKGVAAIWTEGEIEKLQEII